jgi:hypothetical protein
MEKKLGATQGFWTKDAVAIRFVKHLPGLSFRPWLSARLPTGGRPRPVARADLGVPDQWFSRLP